MNLTEAERTILKLFRDCDSVTFCKYECEVAEARVFAGSLGENVERKERDGCRWVEAKRGKVNVAAFLKD